LYNKNTIKQIVEIERKKMTVKELKNIKVVVRWGRNGRKYVWENPTQKKISELIKKYDYEQLCDGCLWLLR
jgi:hypothetical protein